MVIGTDKLNDRVYWFKQFDGGFPIRSLHTTTIPVLEPNTCYFSY